MEGNILHFVLTAPSLLAFIEYLKLFDERFTLQMYDDNSCLYLYFHQIAEINKLFKLITPQYTFLLDK